MPRIKVKIFGKETEVDTDDGDGSAADREPLHPAPTDDLAAAAVEDPTD